MALSTACSECKTRSGPLAPIQFYFDFISPFGYFASLRIDDLGARYGREVEWTSMLVGVSILKVMNLPPIVDLPLKGPYIVRDAERYARRHSVPFMRPASMPMARPLLAGRAFAWANAVDPDKAKRLAHAIFEQYFVHCLDIGEANVIRQCFDRVGFSWTAFWPCFQDGTASEILKINVEQSINVGVFGSPFFLVDREPFFGVEKMEVLEEWMACEGW